MTSSTRTTVTTTRTKLPKEGITEEELEALEEQRKEEAAAAVAQAEAAEDDAVKDALKLLNNTSAPPGLLGQVSIETEAGPVQVAALSMESLADADGPAEISAGAETGASLEISLALLGEVAGAAGAGNGMILLSITGVNEGTASRLATDDVRAVPGARRLASALRSQPISINFRSANGSKIDVRNLSTPMKMKLKVDDPGATCAFWDESSARWSSEGVKTLPSEEPGYIECSTTHLSMFGGVIEVMLRNVLLALTCSTVGSLFSDEAVRKLGKIEWMGRPATLVLILMVVVLSSCVGIAVRADQESFKDLPRNERQKLLMRLNAAPNQDVRGVVPEQTMPLQLIKIEQTSLQTDHSAETDEKGEGELVGGADRDKAGEEESRASDEERKDEEAAEKKKEDEKENKEEAAGGDFELPSMFRTLRGMVTGGLDTVSQAVGGDVLLDSVKQVLENAEASTINRAIAMLRARWSGADLVTASVLETAEETKERDANDHDQVPSSQADPFDQMPSGNAPIQPSRRDATTLRTEGSADAPLDDEQRPGSRRGGTSVREDGAVGVQRRSRLRASAASFALIIGRASRAFRAARRGASEMVKARLMRRRLTETGAGAAKLYLEGNILSRMMLLFPAAHSWLKVVQFSISISYSQRVALIGMKVLSAGMLNAVFFSSSASTPDSDPDCKPKSGTLEYWSQKFSVGIVSATVGDMLILLLFLYARKNVQIKPEWTHEEKMRVLRKWRRRTIFFWIVAVGYKIFCLIYICLFIGNVSKEDAAQWLEATAMSLLQDVVLKPLVMAAILSIMSSVMLSCRPRIKRTIEEKWIEVAMEGESRATKAGRQQESIKSGKSHNSSVASALVPRSPERPASTTSAQRPSPIPDERTPEPVPPKQARHSATSTTSVATGVQDFFSV
eukprot:s3310_g13.t1